MMKEPWFWREKTIAARTIAACLAPGTVLYDAARRLRIAATKTAPAPVPVFCVGNATVGGVGKTPFAIMLAKLLIEDGHAPHFLTRGYSGSLKGPVRVDSAQHTAAEVGDEALLLAATAPTWVAKKRPEGARAAADAGADMVIMDDGYQNRSLAKTLSFLLTDADDPMGNGRLLPAGPLREPEDEAVERADALVTVASDKNTASSEKAADRPPRFHVWLEAKQHAGGKRVVAFCGIGRPERFFSALMRAGYNVADAAAFPDHHDYSVAELTRLTRRAAAKKARLITTEKDMVRLPAGFRDSIDTFPVTMKCDRPGALKQLALNAISQFNTDREVENG